MTRDRRVTLDETVMKDMFGPKAKHDAPFEFRSDHSHGGHRSMGEPRAKSICLVAIDACRTVRSRSACTLHPLIGH